MSKQREQRKKQGERELLAQYETKGLFDKDSTRRYYIGVDAGDKITALCAYDAKGQRILVADIDTTRRILGHILHLANVIDKHDTGVFGFEMIHSYGMSVGQTVFDTCVQIGRMYETALEYSDEDTTDVVLIKRGHIKYHHTGRTSSKDKDVRDALIFKYGDKGTKDNRGFFYGFSADLWQAFAVCAYMAEQDGWTPPRMKELPTLKELLKD